MGCTGGARTPVQRWLAISARLFVGFYPAGVSARAFLGSRFSSADYRPGLGRADRGVDYDGALLVDA